MKGKIPTFVAVGILWNFNFLLYVSLVFSTVRITVLTARKKKKIPGFFLETPSKIINVLVTPIHCPTS